MDIDALFDEFTSSNLPDGWIGWVQHEQLAIPTAKRTKVRPWCRGRSQVGQVEWFPRTTKPPWEGDRYAVQSPPDESLGLSSSGWFVVNAYVRKRATFDPKGEDRGVVDDALLQALYKRLENFYWDQTG